MGVAVRGPVDAGRAFCMFAPGLHSPLRDADALTRASAWPMLPATSIARIDP